jgi:hypothetical protein
MLVLLLGFGALVVAVDPNEGTLLLEGGDDFFVLVVDYTATIRGEQGETLSLREVVPGDRVEYHVESFGSVQVATDLRVIPQPRDGP